MRVKNSLQEKYLKLLEYIKTLDSCVVAFSGGVDSTFLLKACTDVLGNKVLAATIDTPYIPRWEIKEGKDFAKRLKVKHKFITIPIMDEIKNNPMERCYLCKKNVFSTIKKFALEEGYNCVVDGTNFDDTKDYRPGMKALKELDIKSPLMHMGFTKKDIRDLSKQLGLPTWKKPAYACLLSRIPYESLIKLEDLKKIEKSEKYLMNIGFTAVRVRCHGDLARIEVDKKDFKNILEEELLDVIGDKLREYGFKYVTLDVKGYRMSGLELL